jgi:hypothetical protein
LTASGRDSDRFAVHLTRLRAVVTHVNCSVSDTDDLAPVFGPCVFLSSVSGNTSRATVHRASKAHRASCGGGGSGDGADRLSSSDNPPAVLGPGTSSARLEVRATALRAPAPVCAAPDGLVSRRVATFVANARPHRVIAVRHACVTDHHTSGPRDVERRARVRAAVFSYPPLPAPRAVARVSPRRNAVANARPRRVIAARHTYVTDRCASCVWVAPASSGELERVRPHFPYPPPPAPRAIARVSPRRNVSWRTHAHIA